MIQKKKKRRGAQESYLIREYATTFTLPSHNHSLAKRTYIHAYTCMHIYLHSPTHRATNIYMHVLCICVLFILYRYVLSHSFFFVPSTSSFIPFVKRKAFVLILSFSTSSFIPCPALCSFFRDCLMTASPWMISLGSIRRLKKLSQNISVLRKKRLCKSS